MTLMPYRCGAIVLLLAVLPAASAPLGSSPTSSYDRYHVLVERNMFSRDRSQRSERRTERVQPVLPTPEKSIFLKGIIQQNQACVAFLEDTRTGITTQARIGDSVAQGKLKSITTGQMEYELEGRVITVRIGENLEGESTAAMSAHSLSQPASDSEAVPAAAGRKDEAAILERMRQKRREEFGK